MKKKELRKLYRDKRLKLTVQEIDSLSEKILFQYKEIESNANCVYHIFLTIEGKKEINTSYFIDYLKNRGKDIAVSKSDFETNTMQSFKLLDNTQLEISSWGIPEPINAERISDETIDVIFVPLLAFDNKGNRVGYGKGFYDRFFKSCRKDVIKIGLSLFEASDIIEDLNQNDIPLDYCITPDKLYNFSI